MPNKETWLVWPDKFVGWKVIEVHNSNILNVAQMSQPMKVKVKYVQCHLYIIIFWNLSRMSMCYSDSRYLDWFWSYGRKTKPLWRNFSCFGLFFDPMAPQTKIQNSVSIESECSRFLRFRENLVEIGLVDSEKLGWKNINRRKNISRRLKNDKNGSR